MARPPQKGDRRVAGKSGADASNFTRSPINFNYGKPRKLTPNTYKNGPVIVIKKKKVKPNPKKDIQ